MTMKNQNYVCIFTGGSIRGAAYVGALRAMEELGINNLCFVGSSVGSVISVFYAAGGSPDELEKIINSINFDLFKDINFSFSKDFSISKGEHFLEWLREHIEKQFYGENYKKGQNPPVTFKDLKKDVVILTTDILTTSVKVFSKKETPDFEVAQAVRISSSMPGLLKPYQLNNQLLVDGDLSRSWPIWKIVPSLCDYNARMLEFRLEGSKERFKLDNTMDFLNSVYTAFSNFAADHVISGYQNCDMFDYIRLDSGDVNITDFNLSQEKRNELYEMGYQTTKNYFKNVLPVKKANILPHYKIFVKKLLEIQKYIQTSKYILAKNALAELFVDISKARKVIDVTYYDRILDFYEEYTQNLFFAFGLMTIVKNKNELSAKLDEIIVNLTKKTEEMEYFINSVELNQ